VLFIHGWGASQEQQIRRACEIAVHGFVCLTFDLRGHAWTKEQRATVSRADNLRDVLAAYDRLATQSGVDRSVIAVVGSSYGGYLGAILTTLWRVCWLGLRAPALYKDSDWDLPKRQLRHQQDLGAYRRLVVPAEDNRALRACAGFRGDVLLIESENDRVVPHPVMASYLAACTHVRSMTYRVIAGTDHALSEEPWRRAYTAILVSWLLEMGHGRAALPGT
jgi:pimeloyl-ACP methyl ester carboxylesterase